MWFSLSFGQNMINSSWKIGKFILKICFRKLQKCIGSVSISRLGVISQVWFNAKLGLVALNWFDNFTCLLCYLVCVISDRRRYFPRIDIDLADGSIVAGSQLEKDSMVPETNTSLPLRLSFLSCLTKSMLSFLAYSKIYHSFIEKKGEDEKTRLAQKSRID